jgi:multidrug efflux system outer membrane protein
VSARRAVAVAVLAAWAPACMVGPNYKRPSVPVPERYQGDAEAAAADARTLADLPWWDVFDDPVLAALVREALQNGFDARLAAARVEEARALYGGARGSLLPGAGYQGGVERSRADQTSNPSGEAATKWTAELLFSWELDLWGRLRRQTEAARAQYLASEDGRRGVLLSLTSDVASAYFELRELDEELVIARRTTAAFQETHDLFNRRLEGGAASALETARAEGILGNVAAQIPEIERAIVSKETELNLLLGRNPQPVPRDGPLAPLPPAVPAGLPSDLLERRPDVREAEQLLVAANAAVGVAKADFFPRLSLTGDFGNASRELGDLFSHGKTWSLEANLLGPLFSAGRIKENYRASKARFEQAKVRYEATVAASFGDVTRALADRAKLAEAEAQRDRAVRAYREAVRLANVRYASGLSAYFEVLDAQQQLFPAELALAQTRRNQKIAVVNLYRALGGGWQKEREATPPR